MQHAGFVHLHLHSEYSLLDGANKLDTVLALAAEYKIPALALTDHGNMFGAVEFYTKAIKHGIKPIIGCEVYVAGGSRTEKKGHGISSSSHLILLCKNLTGYKNLCKLVTKGFFEGFYYRPRVDHELLTEYNEGLIALSACLKGEVARNIIKDNMKAAKEAALFYKGVFDNNRFFLEIQQNGLPEQDKANEGLISLSRKLEIPLVATNDCHYPSRKDAQAHEVLLCIQTGKTMEDESRMRLGSKEFYFKSPAEMEEAFSACPDAILNTVKVAERCNLELKLGEFHLPDFEVPTKEGLSEYFRRLATEGLAERMKKVKEKYKDSFAEKEKVYKERFETEIETIKSMGFEGYLLIVADFINYAKQCNIPVGPGRGSAAGSLIAYCLKITEIDPIEYHLLFERFLNPERKSMPDIDVDFCIRGRDQVIKYVTNKYGKDNVAQIITFGKMQAKAAIRDVGRALNMPYGEVDKVAKLIPNELNISISGAIKKESRLKELIEQREGVRDLMEIAQSLEGLSRHSSIHAAGIVISNTPLVNLLPLYKGQKDEIVTQYSMKYVEAIGLVKFDFLGLKTLTVIDDATKLISATKGVEIAINDIPLDDKKTYKLLCAGDTTGVFQLESAGMKDLMVRLKPENFEDIIALVALYRPGPMKSGMLDDFIKRKHNKKDAHDRETLPQLKEILKDTYGVIVYQEQVMQIASELAGYSLGDADILRRAMGKKISELMQEQEGKFLAGAKKRGIKEKTAQDIFSNMAKFAEYGFNKSHSAAYALIAYQTAYLKTHYQVEFMAALLSSDMDDTSKIVKLIMECKEKGIDILPPDVNESNKDFTVIGAKIRFGLAAVNNVGEAAIESIIQCRDEGGRFSSIYDFCKRVDLRKVNKRVIESLIKCGAYDTTNLHRSQLMEVVDDALSIGQSHQKDKEFGQFALFGTGDDSKIDDEKYPKIPEFHENMLLSFEKETLGFYVSGHPLAKFAKDIEEFGSVDSITVNTSEHFENVTICGIITKVKEKITKKGDRMAFLTLEDLYGFVEIIAFADVYKESFAIINDEKPVLIKGDIDKNGTSSKIIAKEIIDMGAAAENEVNLVEICVIKDNDTVEKLNRLKELISESEHQGRCRVDLLLSVSGVGEARIKMADRYNVKPSKFLKSAAKSIFGYDVVKLKIINGAMKPKVKVAGR